MSQYRLSEKICIVTEFLLNGHEWYVEGRKLVLVKQERGKFTLGQVTTSLIYGDDQAVTERKGLVSLGMSFSYFLSLVESLTDGDIGRLEQINAREAVK